MVGISFPRVRVSGRPFDRGRQYGTQAADRIRHSIDIYGRVFEHYAGWNWRKVTEHAHTYAPAIETFREHFLEEMRGIAEGADVRFDDILALNVRTEIMFAAVARSAAEGCSALVALPAATEDGHTLLGQNWDWKPEVSATVVVLDVEPEDGPSFVTAVEAGLLAKTGMNSAGIGLATNALVSDQDKGEPGVPYHAVLRAILESETMSDALSAITRFKRASSANYLIAHRDGEAINVEAAPGDYSRVYWAFPVDGVYGHTNHFVCPGFDLKDVELWSGPGSLFRLRRVEESLQRLRGECSVPALHDVFADHFNHPRSVCSHRDPKLAPVEQYVSVLSIIMDLSCGAIWIADGNPCESDFVKLDHGLY